MCKTYRRDRVFRIQFMPRDESDYNKISTIIMYADDEVDARYVLCQMMAKRIEILDVKEIK